VSKLRQIILCIAAVATSVFSAGAGAVNLWSVNLVSHSGQKLWGHAGSQTTSFEMNWQALNAGVHHICEVLWTADGWFSYQTTRASFQGFSGGGENWRASGSVGGHVNTIEYVFRCTDLDITVRETLLSGVTRATNGLTIQSPVNVITTSF
jgi:hypothetical protein